MSALRRLIRSHVGLAALLCAAALAVRLLVPAGYMVSGERGGIAITLCPGTAPAMAAMHHAMPGHPPGHGQPAAPDHAEAPCGFAGLALPMLAAVDSILLVLALALVAAAALRPAGPCPRVVARHLRPPLRGPPADR